MVCSAMSRGLNCFVSTPEVLSNLLMFLTARALIDLLSFCIFADRNRMSLLILIRPVLIASFKTQNFGLFYGFVSWVKTTCQIMNSEPGGKQVRSPSLSIPFDFVVIYILMCLFKK